MAVCYWHTGMHSWRRPTWWNKPLGFYILHELHYQSCSCICRDPSFYVKYHHSFWKMKEDETYLITLGMSAKDLLEKCPNKATKCSSRHVKLFFMSAYRYKFPFWIRAVIRLRFHDINMPNSFSLLRTPRSTSNSTSS